MAEEVQAAAAPASGNAIKISILRTIVFSILSFGLYGFYWFYHTRGVVTKEVGGNDQVGLQTAGLLVPILNFFIYYWLLRDLDKANKQAGGQGFPIPPLWMVLGPVILAIIPLVNLLAGIVGLVVTILVLIRMNEVYDKKGATNKPIGGSEIAVVVAGALLGILFYVAVGAAILAGTSAANSATQLQNTTPTY